MAARHRPSSGTTTRFERWPTEADSASASASAGRGPCSGPWATRSSASAAPWSAARTGKAASSPSPGARCGPRGSASARRQSPTWSRIGSGSRSTAGRSTPRRSPGSSPRCCRLADRVARRHGEPTEFELLTAVVFRHFAEADLDVALVEVGLGGRLDATHAWDGGVAAITNVDLDHTDRLGPTIAAIAREKAPIIERGDRAVTGATGEALAIIRRRARRLDVPLVEVRPAPLLDWDRDGIVVELPVARGHPGRAARPPPGRQRRGRRRGARRPRGRRHRHAPTPHARRAGYAERDVAGTPRAARRRRARHPARWGPQPGRRRGARRGPRRPAAVPRRRAAHARHRHDGGQGRRRRDRGAVRGPGRWPARGSSRPRSICPGRCPPPSSPRAGPRAMPDEPSAGDGARTRSRRSSWRSPMPAGPIVVAGSLYLVGAIRAVLVDDPDLRDPSPVDIHSRPDDHLVHPQTHPAPTRIGRSTFAWGARTFVMGILNVTPDSFSGDGLLAEPDDRRARQPIRSRRPSRRRVGDGRRRRRHPRHRRRVHATGSCRRLGRGRARSCRAGRRRRAGGPPRRADQRRHDQAGRRRGGARGRRRPHQRRLGRRARRRARAARREPTQSRWS